MHCIGGPYRLVIHKSKNNSYKCCSKIVNNINTGTPLTFHEWSECNANHSEQISKYRSIHTSRAYTPIQTEGSRQLKWQGHKAKN